MEARLDRVDEPKVDPEVRDVFNEESRGRRIAVHHASRGRRAFTPHLPEDYAKNKASYAKKLSGMPQAFNINMMDVLQLSELINSSPSTKAMLAERVKREQEAMTQQISHAVAAVWSVIAEEQAKAQRLNAEKITLQAEMIDRQTNVINILGEVVGELRDEVRQLHEEMSKIAELVSTPVVRTAVAEPVVEEPVAKKRGGWEPTPERLAALARARDAKAQKKAQVQAEEDSFRARLHTFGPETSEPEQPKGKRRCWDDPEAVIFEALSGLEFDGVDITRATEVDHRDHTVYVRGVKHFGSWATAIQAYLASKERIHAPVVVAVGGPEVIEV